ncbi:MAG TPA: acetyl-CoA carboxylase biotin carboxyl carrier protein [Candidatus Cybelea sp.]|nr:acetyl-CoA carboxylase biotin carboxyl carrier protein [Candidatus Cybelea sp.]
MAKSPKPSSEMSAVDLPEVERILDFMQTHGLEEFEYERNGFRIRLRRPAAVGSASAPRSPLVEAPAPAASAPSGPEEAVGQAATAEDLHVIKSPIVGTFYASATPGAEPFVKLGSPVETGQVLCIIEAMKLMNEIESDVAGEVARVFVENGHPVEYGQALFGIRPHRKT